MLADLKFHAKGLWLTLVLLFGLLTPIAIGVLVASLVGVMVFNPF